MLFPSINTNLKMHQTDQIWSKSVLFISFTNSTIFKKYFAHRRHMA